MCFSRDLPIAVTALHVTQTCFPPSCWNCHCAYIDTFIPIHLARGDECWWEEFFRSQELDSGTLFELHFLIAFHFDWHWTRVMVAVVARLRMVQERYHSCDCVELIVFSFHYSNKKYEGGGKTFQPVVFVFRNYRILKSSTTVRPVTVFSFRVVA